MEKMQGFSFSDLHTLTLFYFFKWACIVLFKVQKFLSHLEKKAKSSNIATGFQVELEVHPFSVPCPNPPPGLDCSLGSEDEG